MNAATMAAYDTSRQLRAEPVMRRFLAGGGCPPELVSRIAALAERVEIAAPKSLLQTEDDAVVRPRYLLSGWACRFRHLSDGRRQLFDVVLPGEGLGVCVRAKPIAKTSTVAITRVELAYAGDLLRAEVLESVPELATVLQRAADADERRLLNHVVRLGRMTALERLAHLFLELYDRLAVVGQAEQDRFPLLLTQELLADMLGLSVVHVNRTLQELKRQGLAVLERGVVQIRNRSALMTIADYPMGAAD